MFFGIFLRVCLVLKPMDTLSPNGSSQQQSQPPKKYGITKPISLAGPSETDIQRNMELEKAIFVCFFLKRIAYFL